MKRNVFFFPPIIILLSFFAIGLHAQALLDRELQDSLYFDPYLEDLYLFEDGKHMITHTKYGLYERDMKFYRKKRPDLASSFIKYWDAQTGSPLRLEQTGIKELPIRYSNVVDWREYYTDGKRTMLEFRKMPKYDTSKWEINKEYPFNTKNYQIHYLKDNQTIAVFITSTCTIQFYDISTGLLKKEVPMAKEFENMRALHIDGNYAFFYASDFYFIAVDLNTANIMYKRDWVSTDDILFFENKYIVSLEEGKLETRDFMTGKSLSMGKVKNAFRWDKGGKLSVSEDGKYLSVFIDNDTANDFVSVYNLNDLSLYFEYDLSPMPTFASFFNNSHFLFVLTYHHGLNKIDMRTKKWVLNFGVNFKDRN